jgi:hypothetical protein
MSASAGSAETASRFTCAPSGMSSAMRRTRPRSKRRFFCGASVYAMWIGRRGLLASVIASDSLNSVAPSSRYGLRS